MDTAGPQLKNPSLAASYSPPFFLWCLSHGLEQNLEFQNSLPLVKHLCAPPIMKGTREQACHCRGGQPGAPLRAGGCSACASPWSLAVGAPRLPHPPAGPPRTAEAPVSPAGFTSKTWTVVTTIGSLLSGAHEAGQHCGPTFMVDVSPSWHPGFCSAPSHCYLGPPTPRLSAHGAGPCAPVAQSEVEQPVTGLRQCGTLCCHLGEPRRPPQACRL